MMAPGARDQVFRVRSGQVATVHWKWEELSRELIKSSTRVFLMVRDPRDIVVSNAFYIANQNEKHRLHKYFSSLKSDEERILASIQGISSEELGGMRRSKSMGEHLRGFLPWIDQDECVLVRFEDLIGARGGGDEERQRQCIRRIADHIECSLSQRESTSIADRAFSTDSKTFRKGKTGDWRNHFTEQHVQATKKTMGEVLVRLGYEKDDQWEV
jgi:hypothetical protein